MLVCLLNCMFIICLINCLLLDMLKNYLSLAYPFFLCLCSLFAFSLFAMITLVWADIEILYVNWRQNIYYFEWIRQFFSFLFFHLSLLQINDTKLVFQSFSLISTYIYSVIISLLFHGNLRKKHHKNNALFLFSTNKWQKFDIPIHSLVRTNRR